MRRKFSGTLPEKRYEEVLPLAEWVGGEGPGGAPFSKRAPWYGHGPTHDTVRRF